MFVGFLYLTLYRNPPICTLQMPVNGSKMAQTQMLNGESPAMAVNVTDDREACPKHRVEALVKVHSERSVSKKLQAWA